MSPGEAIRTIEFAISGIEWEYPMDYAAAFDTAISALRAQQGAEKNNCVRRRHYMNRSEILDTAKICVCGKREQDYGKPEDNFGTIAQLWTAYKKMDFTATDVAMMMALLKIARISTGIGTEDSFVDLAGYAACGGEIASMPELSKGEIEHEN